MLKRLLLSVVAIAVTVTVSAVTFTYDNVNSTDKTCRVSGIDSHDGLPTVLNIPSTAYTNGIVCTVTAIAPDALNNLPGVKTINIPAGITVIGEHREDVMTSDLKNFADSPDLVEFYVAKANEHYASTDNGFLTNKKGNTLLRCPAKVAVTSGQLVIPAQIYYIPMNAFTGVTSVTKLVFTELHHINEQSGLNLMPYLASIALTGSTRDYHVTNDVLYSSQAELLSFPPRKMLGTFTVPSDVQVITRYAFANTIYLGQITLTNNITNIRNAAFMKSSIRSLTIPSSVTVLGSDVCRSCPQLTSLTFNNDIKRVPDRFAFDCPKLTEVKYAHGAPAEIYNSAFRDCVSLISHPFSGSTLMKDSVFFNTGFVSVVFDKSTAVEDLIWNGKNIFSNCRNLKSIDLSAVDTSDEYYWMGQAFADGCPQLTDLRLPARTYFLQPQWQTSDCYTFGADCHINKVVMSTFTRQGSKPVFCWNTGTTLRPNFYLKLNGTPDTAGAPTHNLCTAAAGTTVKPIYYYERFAPLDKYVDPSASYYVPGGCIENFNAAIEAGCYVEEMFRFEVHKSPSGTLSATLKEVYPDMVRLVSLRVNNQVIDLKSYGEINTAIPYEYVQEIEMCYTAHGEMLTTTYPLTILGGVDDVMADDVQSEPQYFDIYGRRVYTPVPGTLYIVRRGSHTAKQIFR